MASADLQMIDWGQLARCLFKDARDAILLFRHSDQRLTHVNPVAEQLTDMLEHQLLQLSLGDLVSSEDAGAQAALRDACLKRSEFEDDESFYLKRSDGWPRPVSLKVRFVDSGSYPVGVALVQNEAQGSEIEWDLSQDEAQHQQIIDDFKAGWDSNDGELTAEEALAKLRIQDRAIAFTKTGIVIADACLNDMPIIYCNPAFEKMTGFTKRDILGRNCRFLQGHDQGQPGARKAREAIQRQQECTITIRNYRKDGTMFWNQFSISPIRDEHGRLTHYVGCSHDITVRVAGESMLRDSEQQFRTLCRDAPIGIFLTDVGGRVNYINDVCAHILGQPDELIYRDGWVDLLHPDEQHRTVDAWQRAVVDQSVFEIETRFVRSDGSVANVHTRANPRFSDNGRLVGHVGTIVDVTESKRALEALEQSERRYRTLVEDAPEAIMAVDMKNGRFVEWNEATLQLFGTDAETITTSKLWEFFPEKQPNGRDSMEAAQEYMTAALAGESAEFEWFHIDSHGNIIPCEIRLTGLTFGDQQLVRGTVTNISARIESEQQLRRTRLAVENTSDAVFVIDQSGGFIDVNQTACDRLGYSKDELLAMTVSDINPNYPIESWPDHWQQLKVAGKAVYESVHRTRDGVLIPVEISKSIGTVGGQEFAFAFVRDISSRKKVEAILQSTQFAVDNNINAIVRINSRGQLAYINHAACEGLQYSRDELLSMHIWDVDMNWPEDEWWQQWEQIKDAGSSTTETQHRRKDGSLVDCEVTACYVSFGGEEFVFAFCVAITQRKKAEQRVRQRETQLAHVSRLSIMGELVAGIAHEVNQPLYSILNFSKATHNSLANPTQENLRQIEQWNRQIRDAASRAGSIIKRLRDFTSPEQFESAPIDLHYLLDDGLELVGHEIRRAGVMMETKYADEQVHVMVDRVQLQQVLVNLIVNAIEAMEQNDTECRKIVVETGVMEDSVHISIADSGPGFPDVAERNWFDAFVSTKKAGLGMGLAISNTIVESCGGKLTARSNDAGGATLIFSLPLVNTHV